MRVQSDGRILLIGSRELLRAQKVTVGRKAQSWVTRLQKATETPLLLAVDGQLVGLVSLRDTVRPESRTVLDALRADGVRRIILRTGDHPTIAAAVAAELGITEFRAQVRCGRSAAAASPGRSANVAQHQGNLAQVAGNMSPPGRYRGRLSAE
jgi:cation-transporting P-type ATPase C